MKINSDDLQLKYAATLSMHLICSFVSIEAFGQIFHLLLFESEDNGLYNLLTGPQYRNSDNVHCKCEWMTKIAISIIYVIDSRS